MKTLQNALRDCDLQKGCEYLTSGLNRGDLGKYLLRYYSLFCTVQAPELFAPQAEMVLTGYEEDASSRFRGVIDTKERKLQEAAVDWRQVLLQNVRLCLPDCIVDVAGAEYLMAAILAEMERAVYVENNGADPCVNIQTYSNSELFWHMVRANRLTKERMLKVTEKWVAYKLSEDVDKECVFNEILEWKERRGTKFRWKDLLAERDMTGNPFASYRGDSWDDAMSVNSDFLTMDVENPPNLLRYHRCKRKLTTCYHNISLADYQEVVEEHKRIVIERNKTNTGLPFIFVRDKYGQRVDLRYVDLSELVCMDIFVMDPQFRSADKVLATLVYYLEYPLRVERKQKQWLFKALFAIKKYTMD